MARLRAKKKERNGKEVVSYYFADFYDRNRYPNRKRLSLGTRNKEAAKHKLAELEKQYAMGIFDPWTDKRVADSTPVVKAVAKFVASREGHCSKPTVDTYNYVLELFARGLAADLPLDAVEAHHIDTFLARDLADATRTNYRQRLRIFFSWCKEEGLCKSNPVVIPRNGKSQRKNKLPEFLTEDEFERLLTTISTDATMHPGIDDNQWLLDAVTFTAYTGLRRAELCNLQWRHIDLQGGFLTVANTESFSTKSGRERRVPLAPQARELLERLSGDRSNEDDRACVFRGATGDTINGQYLSKRFRHYRRMGKLATEFNFHSLRHTFASWAAQRGMNLYTLKEILGHSDIKQTQIYASLSPDSLTTEMERVFGT